jgi:cell division protein FtsB
LATRSKSTPRKASQSKSRTLRRDPQDVLIRRIIGGLAIAFFGLFVVRPAIEPVKIVLRYQNLLSEQQAEGKKLREQNNALAQRVAWLNTREGKEVLARESGYHAPNEEVFHIKKGPRSLSSLMPVSDRIQPNALPKPIQ